MAPLARFLIALAGILYPCVALAEASTSRTPSAAPSGLIVMLLIAYGTRHKAIGGWLLYYYICLYVGLVVLLLLFLTTFKNLAPSEWDDSFLYVMELISYFPPVLLQVGQTVLATILLRRRTLANLNRLRFAMLALIVAQLVSLGINAKYFTPEAAWLDAFALAITSIWTWYFFGSKRVRAVFVDHSWVAVQESKPTRQPLTPEQVRKARIRAVVVGVGIYLLILIAMASAREGTPPDVEMLVVPLVYAALAALIARYLRLS